MSSFISSLVILATLMSFNSFAKEPRDLNGGGIKHHALNYDKENPYFYPYYEKEISPYFSYPFVSLRGARTNTKILIDQYLEEMDKLSEKIEASDLPEWRKTLIRFGMLQAKRVERDSIFSSQYMNTDHIQRPHKIMVWLGGGPKKKREINSEILTWWCSEYSRWLLAKSKFYNAFFQEELPAELEQMIEDYLLSIDVSDDLVAAFENFGDVFVQYQNHERVNDHALGGIDINTIEPGDYLSFTHPTEEPLRIPLIIPGGPLHSAWHSSMVLWVDREEGFIYTLEGNNHAGNRVGVYKKKLYIENENGVKEVNPSFLAVGKPNFKKIAKALYDYTLEAEIDVDPDLIKKYHEYMENSDLLR